MANKDTNILMSYFEASWQKKYSIKPNINRYKSQYGFAAMLEQYGMLESKAVVDYFFGMQRQPHKVEDLLYNYEKVKRFLELARQDDIDRKRIREETRQRVEEWRQSGN